MGAGQHLFIMVDEAYVLHGAVEESSVPPSTAEMLFSEPTY